MIKDDGKSGQLNRGTDYSQCVVLTRHTRLSHAMLLMKNKSNVHLIVFSNGPLSDSGDYTIVLQQKFGDNYLALIKKVTLERIL